MRKKKTTPEPPQEVEGWEKPISARIKYTKADGSEGEVEEIAEQMEHPPTLGLRMDIDLGDSQGRRSFTFMDALGFIEIGNSMVRISELLENEGKFKEIFTGSETDWLRVLHAGLSIKDIASGLSVDQKKRLAEIERSLGILKNKRSYRQAIHSLTQFYPDKKQLTLFSPDEVDEYYRQTGLKIGENKPDSFGVVLNVAQMRVFEGILKAFSETNYQGNKEITIGESIKEGETGIDISSGAARERINKAYKDKATIPVIQITQSELLELSGYDRTHNKTEVIEALDFLGTQQFCFFWRRLVSDPKGNPVIDKKSGKWAKEEVMEVGTLFRIKFVREEGGGQLKYYEIHPSAALIDQINNYFLMIPYNWREEVKQLTGNRGSKYTYQFLIWLRLKFEEIRRHNNRKGKSKPKPRKFEIPVTWEEIAIALGMPESRYKANRLKAKKDIDKAYSVAIKLGYLLKVEDTGAGDRLYLNEDYFPKPGDLK
jgi:hypothetical protein